MRCSRRHALRLIGASGVITATAGCLNPGSLDNYALIASEQDLSSIERPYLRPDPTEIDATTKVDFPAETKQQYTSELFNTGSVTVQQWPLVGRDRWGKDTRPRPTFLRKDGVYYQVQISEERHLERERWHFAVTRTDETPPDEATVERPPFDRSAQDRRILEAALDAVYAGNDGFLGEPQFEELQTVEYHRHLDPEASELVPSPPFEYVEYGDEYFRPVTEQRTVTVPEWTYTLDELTDTRVVFEEHARPAILELDLSSLDLSGPARGVIDDAISEEPRRYEEGAPPSEGLTEILEALGIAEDLQPIDSYDDRVDFRGVVAEYRGTVYRFSLIVTP